MLDHRTGFHPSVPSTWTCQGRRVDEKRGWWGGCTTLDSRSIELTDDGDIHHSFEFPLTSVMLILLKTRLNGLLEISKWEVIIKWDAPNQVVWYYKWGVHHWQNRLCLEYPSYFIFLWISDYISHFFDILYSLPYFIFQLYSSIYSCIPQNFLHQG